MSNEPEYLRKLRQSQERRAGPAPAPGANSVEGNLSIQEREAVRWARETAGTELRAVKNLAGARYAILIRVQSATGTKHHSIEGLATREALLQRLLPGAGMGEEILATYEVKGGRPIDVKVEAGTLKLVMGQPRPGAHPLSPEKMLRKAAADAAARAKSRPSREGDRGGRRGR